MHRINWLLTFSSLTVLLVTIERFSATTSILLQPYSFLHLHEALQITTLILFTVLIPLFLLKEATHNWDLIKDTQGMLWLTIFIIGIYFYATGNGIHELASFQFNYFCDTKHISGIQCGGMFFNDYYIGNGVYFLGGLLMNLPLLWFERRGPNVSFMKKDLPVLWINSGIYALAIFAYAAFDRVLVGLVYSVIMTIIITAFFLSRKKQAFRYPITLSLFITYTLGTLASLFYRLW